MVRGLVRGSGRSLQLHERAASYLALALLAAVVATIVVTVVLLLVRTSPTPTAARPVEPHGSPAAPGSPTQNLARAGG